MLQVTELPFDVTLPPVRILKAGALSCMYEMGNLRYIKCGKVELVRMIYVAVRNEQWETIPYELLDEEIKISESGFSFQYTMIFGRECPIYKAQLHLEGFADNRIVVSMKGEAIADFNRNRIGLCVLHPIQEWSGKTATVTRPDGTQYESVFPKNVSPSLPFVQVKKMEMGISDNAKLQFSFEGDIYETEDQRNWSDSSYKTYSTPSYHPRPVQTRKGDTVEQRITLQLSGMVLPEIISENSVLHEEKILFPRIGYSRSVRQQNFSAKTIELLHNIPFDHYRVELALYKEGWQQLFRLALYEAVILKTKLELAVFFSGNYVQELDPLIEAIREEQMHIQNILLLQKDQPISPEQLLEYCYPVFKANFPAILIGYGTDAAFMNLNGNRPGKTPCDFLNFSLHPQGHAFDTRTIMENLENQPDLLQTIKEFAPGKLVCVSPVTFKDRHNANTGGEKKHSHTTVAGYDNRYNTAMSALWTLVSIQNLGEAYSITLYELFGSAGILQKSNNIDSQKLPGINHIYKVLETIHNFNPRWIVKRYSQNKLLMDGLMLENEQGKRLSFKGTGKGLD